MDASSSSYSQFSPQCRKFTIPEIHLATQNFNDSLVIGRGGFGRVYKGSITDGATHLVAAIKRLDSTSNQGEVEFWNEVQMLSKLRHCNLVSLIGYCNDGKEMVLVYEYMPHGTLEDHLHKRHNSLTWVRLLKICIGAARGLDYLHTGTGINHGIIHRDVKSSNILLDDSWAAKISDFGLSKFGPINQPSTYVNTFVKGTFGYLDPHYFSTGRLTRKSDVYAFGVVLFEVLSGKRAADGNPDDEHWGLVNWAQESIKQGRLKQTVDNNIREGILPKCLKKYARLAERCWHSNPKQRPTMFEVVVCLESILALQEKASKTLHPPGMTIFCNKVPMFLFRSNGEKSVGAYFDTIGGEFQRLLRFKFEIIKAATENFSEKNKISRCSYTFYMYKGRLQTGQGISIAGPYFTSKHQHCKNEVSLLHVKLEHENLLQLLGYSLEGTQVFLVYDFAVSATLYDKISGPLCTLLDSNKRNKIILDVARVLLYLHQLHVIHGCVTPGNILLDECFDPKLSDFRLSRCLAINEADCIRVDAVRGSLGYIAPEVLQANRMSTKADVYSFGVLILETITGCSIYSGTLVKDVWTNWLEGTLSIIIDHRIHANSSSITRFIHAGLLCVQLDAADKPTMEEVVGMLTNTSSLPLPIPKRLQGSIFEEYVDHTNSLEILISNNYYFGAAERFISELNRR